ncbi:MAG: type II toxin-antitoxin system prevent-host-death family antitoxin [Acidimicrobiales bacterium]|nr:type II toxin-antitoxin system prevent-host-death family antitoxin [Acidimicrobiales bacterium]
MASEVGIRALKQNASAVVAKAAAGEVITITDHGRPVAQLVPLPTTALAGLIAAGLARPATRAVRDLPRPAKGPALSPALRELRESERY